jgi:hypothetical protein
VEHGPLTGGPTLAKQSVDADIIASPAVLAAKPQGQPPDGSIAPADLVAPAQTAPDAAPQHPPVVETELAGKPKPEALLGGQPKPEAKLEPTAVAHEEAHAHAANKHAHATPADAHAVDVATMHDPAAAHELAHTTAQHGDPGTAGTERPGLGKPQEIADRVETMDPRGAAKPDLGDQVASLHQLAQPQSTELSPEQAEELAQPAHDGDLALDQLHDPKAIDPAVVSHEAKIQAAHDARLAKAVHHHEAEHQRHREQAGHQRQQVGNKSHQAIGVQRRSVEEAKAHKHASKDELRAKLTAAADAKRKQLDQDLETKKTELDGKLKAKLDSAKAALDKANEKLTAELDAQAKKLEGDIAKRKAAHDVEITRQKAKLEDQSTKEQDGLRAKAKGDADAIKLEAGKQATATADHAEQRAKETEAKGATEAAAAIASGNTQAKRATDAAEARATALTDAGEAEHVRGEGRARAEMAHSQAAKRAEDLKAQAKSEAQKLRDKGKADHDAEIKHGDERAAEAITNGDTAADKVKAATTAAVAKMQAESDAAVAKMTSEVAQMKTELEAKRATMNANGTKAIADAEAKIASEQTKALADMQAAHDKAKQTIDDSVVKDLDKIEHASEKDLAHLEQEVDRDIAKINEATRQAEVALDRSIAVAEQKAQAQVGRATATINTDRNRALGQLRQSAAAARQRIAADDKETKHKIDAAASQGGKDIAAASSQASADLATANQKLVDATKTEGDTHRAEADKQAATAATAMEESRKRLDGEISQAWVDDAVAKSHQKMERSITDWAVTDAEAVEAMNNLNSLPDAEQGQAIKQLDSGDFSKLLHEVPEERREEFKSLVDNTHDPQRKLELWGEYQKSHVANDAKKDAEATKDVGWWPFESAEQDKNRHRNSARDRTVSDNNDEVDDELKFLEEKAKAGTLTEADVEALEHRKEHEHQLERKYGVDITNKEGTRANGTKIAWTDDELDQIDSALGRVPEASVIDNDHLKKIVRSDISSDEDDPANPVIGGQHSTSGVITIYDVGKDPGYRIDGANRELADPSVAPSVPSTLGSIEVSLDHELGHDMHDKNPDAFKRYKDAAGWQADVDDDQMKDKGGISQADIDALRQASKDHKHKEIVGKDGKVYENDPYSKGDIIAYDKDALPTTADAQPGATPINSDTWWYQRENPKDDFADQYTKAVHTPETLAKDMIDAPATRVTNANAQLKVDSDALAAEQAKPTPDPIVISALTAKKQTSEAEVAAANKEQTARKTQFDIMRDDIFHTNTATDEAVKRLEAKGVDRAKIDEFKAKAARASTPQQIKVLESGY